MEFCSRLTIKYGHVVQAEQSHGASAERPTNMSVMDIPTNWRRWRLRRGAGMTRILTIKYGHVVQAEQSHGASAERPTNMSVMDIPTNWRRWRLRRGAGMTRILTIKYGHVVLCRTKRLSIVL